MSAGGRQPGVYEFSKGPILRMLGYAPHTEEVRRFHLSRARIRMPVAPARTSKSMSTAYDVVAECFPRWQVTEDGRSFPVQYHRDGSPYRVYAIGPDYKTNKEFDYMWTLFKYRSSPVLEGGRRHDLGKAFPFSVERGASYSPKQGNMELSVLWGNDIHGQPVRSVIEGKSATNPESLQGEEIDLWIQSEAAEQAAAIWTRYGSTRAKRAIFPTTPKITGAWLKDLIDFGESVAHGLGCTGEECEPGCQKMAVGCEWFQFTPHSNPTYDWERYWQEHAKAESRVDGRILTEARGHDCFDLAVGCRAMRDAAFAEQFGGRWTFDAERVIPFRWTNDNGPSHVVEKLPEWWHAARYYVAFDHGYTDPAAVLWAAVGTDGTTLLYREIYESGMDPRMMVERVVETSRRHGEQVSMYVPDPQRPEVANVLRELGLPMAQVKSGVLRDRAAGHARLVDALSTDPELGRPRLYVLSERAGGGFGCPKTIAEWKTLRRKPTVGNEFSPTAFEGADHAFDAARYLLMAHPTKPPSERWRIDAAIRRQILENQMIRRRAPGAFDARWSARG